jgi:transcriptional regulator with XRE-family HTH domain
VVEFLFWNNFAFGARKQGKLLLKELASKYDVTPGLVSQYYRGELPLNVKWKMRFAEWLGVSPAKIWPDFEHKALVTKNVRPELLPLIEDLEDYDDEQIAALQQLVSATKRKARREKS